MTVKKLFAFGYGSTAAALDRRLRAQGWQIAGTCRTAEKAARLKEAGVEAWLLNEDEKPGPGALDGATHLLISAPPGANGDPVLAAMAEAIRSHCGTIEWIGYLSTTGVYGDRDGAEVTEEDAVRPISERGRRRAEAEAAWLALGEETGIPVQIFRLAGIYGPGRNQIVSLRQGKARRIVKPGHVFSRIHVDDIAAVLEASIGRPRAGGIYNVCDDEAAPPQDVVLFAADLAGLAPPPEISLDAADLSPMARSFYDETKRVSNARIKSELGVTLRYPTYREGLRALFEAGA